MIINYLHKIGWFIGLVLLQVLILNNVHIVGYATPFLYIYLILKFESDVPRNALMLWAFFLGLAYNGNLSFSEIFGCQCLGTSRDAAYPRILLLCPHRHVVVENCNKRFADCNLYNGGRGYTEEVKRGCLVMCIRIYNS